MSTTLPAPSDGWIEGDFEGVYAGDRHTPGGVRDARRFDFQLQSGTLRNFEAVDAALVQAGEPDAGAAPGPAEVRQERVRRVTFVPNAGDGSERTLFDVRIRDYRLRHPAEIRGRAYGTIVGRIRARLTPITPESPPLPLPLPSARTAEPLPQLEEPGIVDAPPLGEPTHEAVVGTDTRLLLSRLRRALAWLAWLLVAGLFAWLCGSKAAAFFAAPIGAAMLLRSATARFAVSPAPVQTWLGIALVAGQIGLVAGDYAGWWQGACRGPLTAGVLWLAAPVLVAGLLRLRWPLLVTGLLWTGLMCIGCAAGVGDCAAGGTGAQQAGLGSAGTGAGRASGPGGTPRTDADGRWPPGLGLPALRNLLGGAPGDSAGGAVGRVEAPSGEIDVGRVEAPAGEGRLAIEGSGSLPSVDEVPVAPGREAPRRGVASVPGGWVAPEDPSGEPDLRLISIEYANRNPEAFFGGGGSRRVYLQTDPIFESGGSRLRAKGPFELTRLANLLRSSPGQRVVIEVHTDNGGGPREQLARGRRRAEVVTGFLVTRGHLDADRFQVVPVGGGSPIVPRDGSYAAQAPNRRLEVRLVPDPSPS